MNEVWRNRDGIWQYITSIAPTEYSGQAINGAKLDNKGRIWIMYTDASLRCCEILSSGDSSSTLRTIQIFKPGSSFSKSGGSRFLFDRNDLLWYSFFGVGAAVFDVGTGKCLRVYSNKDSPPYTDVGYLLEDHSGNMWLCGARWGVGKLNGGFYGNQELKVFDKTNGLASNVVSNIMQDSRHQIWIATLMGGTSIIQDTAVRSLTTKDGLPSDFVVSIKEDGDGNMWVGTFTGLAKVDVQNNYQIEKIDALQGELIHSCKISTNGIVGVATEDAFIAIDLNKFQKDTCPTPIYITGFNADGEHVEYEKRELEFSHTQTYFMIDYTGVSLRFESGLQYQYKLDGIDADWQPPKKERKVILAALEPGDYTFKVKAITPKGIESVQPAILHFTIHPPFYQRLWFIILGSGIIGGGVASYVRYRISKVQKAHRKQQEFSQLLIDSQEKERKRIAAELHDSVGQNLLIIKNRALLGLETCPDDQPTTKELQTISSISSQTIDEVREISYNLRPYQLDRLGLTKAIQSLINRIKESFNLKFIADITSIDNLLPKDSEIIIYRVIQEGLNNVVKHSNATEVKVTIKKNTSQISIIIEDNGRGFDVNSTLMSQEGFGLKGITERIRILDGTLSINSSPEKVTTLSISIPFKGEQNEK